jgi:hypothetical protein
MHLVGASDEIASETQLSEGWTYAVLTGAALNKIDSAVASCSVKHFHGKKFKPSQESDYCALLSSAREQLQKTPGTRLLFTLNDLQWKATLIPFTKNIIDSALKNVGITDPTATKVAKHLFPGLITFQRLTRGSPGASIEVEVDSDNISKLLGTTNVAVKGLSLPLTRILTAAYEGYRKQQFPDSPQLTGSLRALDDATSRCIQVADVFGNFALSRLFVELGQSSRTRDSKARIFDDVFGDIVDVKSAAASVALSSPNDIQILQNGAFTLEIA